MIKRFFKLCILFGIFIFLNSCKKDESYPDLNDVVLSVSPSDGDVFVPLNSKIKIVLKKMDHHHENDVESVDLTYGIWLDAYMQNISGNTELIIGEIADTLIYTPTEVLPYNHTIKVNYELYWLNSSSTQFGDPVNKSFEIRTVPSTIPKLCIKSMYPENNSSNISVQVQPSISFIYPIDKEINVNNQLYKYAFRNISMLANNNTIEGTTEWNENNDRLIFKPNNELPENSSITMAVNTQLMVKINGVWKEAELENTQTHLFTTQNSGTEIFLSDADIEFSYPVKRQYNFYKDEFDKGYLKTKTSYTWFENSDVLYTVQFTTPNHDFVPIQMNYFADKKYFEFDIPNFLENNRIYKISFIRNLDGESTVFYSLHFKTSIYNTFSQKLNSFNITSNMTDFTKYNGVHRIGAYFEGEEFFDESEIITTSLSYDDEQLKKSIGLIQIENDLNNRWYQNFIGPHLYSVVEKGQVGVTYRKGNIFGFPPTGCGYFEYNDAHTFQLSDAEIESNTPVGYTNEFIKLISNQGEIVHYDHMDIINQISEIPENEWTDEMKYLTLNSLPGQLSGGYYYNENFIIKLKLKYTIPCINKVTTEKEITILQ